MSPGPSQSSGKGAENVSKGALTSNEVNFLVYRYLLESGFGHAAFVFGCESDVDRIDIDGKDVPVGALVSFVQKGFQMMELEANLNASGNDVYGKYVQFTADDILTKDLSELREIAKEIQDEEEECEDEEEDTKGVASRAVLPPLDVDEADTNKSKVEEAPVVKEEEPGRPASLHHDAMDVDQSPEKNEEQGDGINPVDSEKSKVVEVDHGAEMAAPDADGLQPDAGGGQSTGSLQQ